MDNPNNRYYFNPPQHVPKTPEEAKAMAEAKAENDQVWARSGHRGIYAMLIK